jgi:CDP-diglyceride synthetase
MQADSSPAPGCRAGADVGSGEEGEVVPPGDLWQFIIGWATAMLLGSYGLFGLFGDGIWRLLSGLIFLLGLVSAVGSYRRARR